MRSIVCFFVCFISLCCSQRDYTIRRVKYGDKINSFQHDKIYRPCVLHDLDCIRRVFASYSNCKPVKGPIEDPYLLDLLPIHLAHANVTYIMNNVQFRGLNDWKIQEFFINKATNTLILEVVFDAITVYTPAAIVRYHRKGKEAVELSDYSTVIYKDISLTLTVPNVKDFQLSEGYVYAYIPDSNPPYSVGSGMMDDSDPTLSAVFKDMESNIGVGLREVFVYKGPAIMNAFLEGNICDFYIEKTQEKQKRTRT